MNRQKIRSAYVICVILFGILTNVWYGIDLFRNFFEPRFDHATREIIISAVALEFGWAVLLLWAICKPSERGHIVLITAVPVGVGNLLHSVSQSIYAHAEPAGIALNLLVGGVVVGLFVLAFYLSNWRWKAD